MTPALPARQAAPLSELNTTPLIDILLVLLVMLIFTLPPLTNTIELPMPSQQRLTIQPDRVRNLVTIAPDDTILWNGQAVSEGELQALLGLVIAMRPEPEIELAPDGRASYEATARVLRLVKLSGASRIGFVGNERYRAFQR